MTRHIAVPLRLAVPLFLAAACADRPGGVEPDRALRQSVLTTAALEQLGEALFDDHNLSINRNQACNACHFPEWGFTGPNEAINAGGAVYEGSIPGRFGNRKPPSSAYATQSPVFTLLRNEGGLYVGGNFWDGRATGAKLGNPAADQAQGPFVNPAEQALRDPACVVFRVANAAYAPEYIAIWGAAIATIVFPADMDALCGQEGGLIPLSADNRAKVDTEYDNIARSIEAYEASPEVNTFSSKFDAWRKGQARLTRQEQEGFALFQGKAKCNRCHPSAGQQPLFTDFTYDNLGVPPNPLNPALLATGFVDLGLGGPEGAAPGEAQFGQMKVPTLRNVDRRPFPSAIKAYTHNGVFKSLEQVVHFYNTRDVLPTCPSASDPGFGVTCWPAPEVAVNVNREELGNLGLTAAQEAALVAFLKTLSDGFTP
ncbi:MAG TPA: cytochrome c peroxidase [Longimicrobiales bacterium]|nr:cytochrome c peroxidase [Longimicrobiales bacterium]